MAAPKVGGLRTMSAREEADAGVEVTPSAPASFLAGYKHVFQSRRSGLWLTLTERITHWMPNGSSKEEIPKTKAGSRRDMVRFLDFFFKTNDDELAEELKASKLYNVEFWSYADKVKEQAVARAAEIRAALAADPELAKALKLTPSDKKDWDVKAPAEVPVPSGEPSLEELERLTKPSK